MCRICGKVVASVPDKIQFMSDSGPVIFVCYISSPADLKRFDTQAR